VKPKKISQYFYEKVWKPGQCVISKTKQNEFSHADSFTYKKVCIIQIMYVYCWWYHIFCYTLWQIQCNI